MALKKYVIQFEITQMECDRLREKRAELEFFFGSSIDIAFFNYFVC